MEILEKAEVGIPQEAITGEVLRGRGPRRGNLEDLLRYWRPIMKKPGGFRRCVVTLMDKPQFAGRPQRICAWLHHEITGKWPNEGNHHRGGVRKGKVRRSVRRGRRGKSFDSFTEISTKNALSLAVRESRALGTTLTQPIAGRQNVVDYKAALIKHYSAPVSLEFSVKSMEDVSVEVKRVGLFGSRTRLGQGLQAAGSIALPGDLSDVRSPVRSQIYEALTPGVPNRPSTRGAARRLIGGSGARNKFRCPPGFENGGTFTNSQFSTCGAQVLRIPNVGFGSLDPASMRSLARLSRDVNLVRTIGDLRSNTNAAEIIRAAQIPQAPKKVNAVNVKKSTDYILERLLDGDNSTDRVVRRDGVILEPVVSLSALGGFDEFDDMADGTYVAANRSNRYGSDELALFTTGIRDVLFDVEGVGAIRVARVGGELSPEDRESVRNRVKDIKDTLGESTDPTILLREFVDKSDGKFSLELLIPNSSGSYVPADEKRNEPLKVQSGGQTIIVPRWVYETFLSRGAPRRSPNDPIFEIVDSDTGGSKSENPFFFTDASRYNRKFDLKAHWFKTGVQFKVRGSSAAVFDVNLGQYRCPPGTSNGGAFTDNAGTNCGGKISDGLVAKLTKLFNKMQRITDRSDALGAAISKNPGLDSRTSTQVRESSGLAGVASTKIKNLVEEIGPVKLSSLGMTIEDILTRESLSDDDRRLLNGEQLLDISGRLNILVTESDNLSDATPEELEITIKAINDLASAEALRKTVYGSVFDDASTERSSAINTLLIEAADVLDSLTGGKPKKDKVRKVSSDMEGSGDIDIDRREPDPDSAYIVGGSIMDESDLQQFSKSSAVNYSDVRQTLVDIGSDFLFDDSSDSEIIEGWSTRLAGVSGDLDDADEEERLATLDLLRDFIELITLKEESAKEFDSIDMNKINDSFSRLSDDLRTDLINDFLSAEYGDDADMAALAALAAFKDSETVEDVVDVIARQQAEKRLKRSADVPDFVDVPDTLSPTKSVKVRQREKAKQIIREVYSDGRTPWDLGEAETLADLADIEDLINELEANPLPVDLQSGESYLSLTPKPIRQEAAPLINWASTALMIDEPVVLESVDVYDDDGNLLHTLTLENTIVTRGYPRLYVYDDKLAIEFIGHHELRVTIKEPGDNSITQVILEDKPADPEFEQEFSRTIMIGKDGSLLIENDLFISERVITSSESKVNRNYSNDFLNSAIGRLSNSINTNGENAIGATGYGLADKVNMHAFFFYAQASKNTSSKPSVNLHAGYDGPAIWGRKGYRSSNPTTIFQLNQRMKKMVEDYRKNDGSMASQVARAVIKDERRLAEVEKALQPFDYGAEVDDLPGHGDFQLLLDGVNGEQNAAAFFFFRGEAAVTSYTPQSRYTSLLKELGDEDLAKAMNSERNQDIANGEFSTSDVMLTRDEKLGKAQITIDHLDDIEIEPPSPAATVRANLSGNGSIFSIVPDREDMASVEDAVAFLSSGGSVADIPDSLLADSLIAAASNPDVPRFQMLGVSESASSVALISDTLTNINYGIKGMSGAHHPNEIAAEIIGPHIAELLGFNVGAVRMGASRQIERSGGVTVYDSYPVVIQFADSLFKDWKTRDNGDPHDLKASKKSLVGMVLLDIIISNTDRNSRNYGVGDGTYFPFDYGGSLALIRPEDRAFYSGRMRPGMTESDYLNSLIKDSISRMGSPWNVNSTLIGERSDISSADIANEMKALLIELREKDLSELKDLMEMLSSINLQTYRGDKFDRPPTDQPALLRSYETAILMIEHLLSKSDEEITELAESVYMSASGGNI